MVVFVTVAGYSACPRYNKAVKIVEKLSSANKHVYLVKQEMKEQAFRSWARDHKVAGGFTESPLVWLDDASGAEPESNFIGGFEALEELANRPVDTWFTNVSSE